MFVVSNIFDYFCTQYYTIYGQEYIRQDDAKGFGTAFGAYG